MAEGNVSYKLDLIVHLMDTTTGLPINQREVMFCNENQIIVMQERGDGTYILLNHGRVDMQLTIKVKGYLDTMIPIKYEELSQQYPTIEAQLIPVIKQYGYHDICSLEGIMPGISDIAAISLTGTDAMLGSYNPKKLTIRLFSTRRLDENDYAVFHKENMEFEEFRIVKKTESGLLLQIKEPLKTECKPEEGIARIVRGMTDVNGRYLLRVRKDGKGTDYLVRYTVNGKIGYERIIFGEQKERSLGQDGCCGSFGSIM